MDTGTLIMLIGGWLLSSRSAATVEVVAEPTPDLTVVVPTGEPQIVRDLEDGHWIEVPDLDIWEGGGQYVEPPETKITFPAGWEPPLDDPWASPPYVWEQPTPIELPWEGPITTSMLPADAYWPDASRGMPEPGMVYAQVLTPVDRSNIDEIGRWIRMYPERALPVPVGPPEPLPVEDWPTLAPEPSLDIWATRDWLAYSLTDTWQGREYLRQQAAVGDAVAAETLKNLP